ncbi:MAG: hypothetical protein GWP68_09680 [Verrucomicrobiaceae bacterium]|nr:hypothetical protein [Verrucomicrobiaceae bacterium]
MSYFGEAISAQDPARHEVASSLELELPRSGSPLAKKTIYYLSGSARVLP